MAEDRRIRRTQKLLTEALSELIGEKEYSTITVSDISERADIAARTFYRHFENIDDLMLSIIRSQINDFEENVLLDLTVEAFTKNGELLFQYVKMKHQFFSVLFESRLSHKLIPEMINGASKVMFDVIQKETKNTLHTNIIIHHVVTSIMSLIQWWIENKMPLNETKMGKIYAEMIIDPVKKYIDSLK